MIGLIGRDRIVVFALLAAALLCRNHLPTVCVALFPGSHTKNKNRARGEPMKEATVNEAYCLQGCVVQQSATGLSAYSKVVVSTPHFLCDATNVTVYLANNV